MSEGQAVLLDPGDCSSSSGYAALGVTAACERDKLLQIEECLKMPRDTRP